MQSPSECVLEIVPGKIPVFRRSPPYLALRLQNLCLVWSSLTAVSTTLTVPVSFQKDKLMCSALEHVRINFIFISTWKLFAAHVLTTQLIIIVMSISIDLFLTVIPIICGFNSL